MTRKRLPKAIRPSSSELVLSVVGAVADNKGSAAKAVSSSEAIEPDWVPQGSSAVPANDTFGARPERIQKLAAKRRVYANRIVERHGTLAAISALAPVPVFNVAGVAVVVMNMLKQLSGLYQVEFERDRMRLFVISILGGAAPTGLGVATVSTLGLLAPAPAFLGIIVSTLTAASMTRAIGEVFVESFERQAPLH
jgi:uncharacterized protein (DUF697 family)